MPGAAAKKADAVEHNEGSRFRVEGKLARHGGGMRLQLVKEKLASGGSTHEYAAANTCLEVKTAPVIKKGCT